MNLTINKKLKSTVELSQLKKFNYNIQGQQGISGLTKFSLKVA